MNHTSTDDIQHNMSFVYFLLSCAFIAFILRYRIHICIFESCYNCCYNISHYLTYKYRYYKSNRKRNLNTWCIIRKKTSNLDNLNEEICSICQDNFTIENSHDGVFVLKCNHFFHKNCINEWHNSRSENYNKCPICLGRMKVLKYYIC